MSSNCRTRLAACEAALSILADALDAVSAAMGQVIEVLEAGYDDDPEDAERGGTIGGSSLESSITKNLNSSSPSTKEIVFNITKHRRQPRFVPPKADEVTEYAKWLGYDLDGQAFCTYYEARGWRMGKTRMKSWRAAVRNWKVRNDQRRAAEDQKLQEAKAAERKARMKAEAGVL